MFVFKIANIYYSLLFILLHNFYLKRKKKSPQIFFLYFLLAFSLIWGRFFVRNITKFHVIPKQICLP